jgi:hypothetical protein
MCWDVEGNELRNGSLMDSGCIAFVSVCGDGKLGSDRQMTSYCAFGTDGKVKFQSYAFACPVVRYF